MSGMDPNLLLFAKLAASGQGGRAGPGAQRLLANLRPGGNAPPPQPTFPGQQPGMPQAGPPPAGPAPAPPPPAGPAPGMPAPMPPDQMPDQSGMPPGMMPGGPPGPPPGPQAGQSALPVPGMPPSPLEAMGIGSRAAPQMPPGMIPPGAQPPISPAQLPGQGGSPPGPQGQGRGALDQAAAAGRMGDDRMAHVSPGDIVIPPQIASSNPQLIEMLNQAFSNAGVNPTSRMVGHPDVRLNPTTGEEEFGFLDSILPMALAIGASMIGAPYLAPAIAGLGVGAETAGMLATGLTSAAGSTAGGLLTGKPFGQAALGGLLSGVGGTLGGALAGANYGQLASGAGQIFGTGAAPALPVLTEAGMASSPTGMGLLTTPVGQDLATPTATQLTGVGASPQTGSFEGADVAIRNPGGMEKLASGGLGATGDPLKGYQPSFLSQAWDRMGGLKGVAGTGIGSLLGGAIAEDLFPQKPAAVDLGPRLADIKAGTVGGLNTTMRPFPTAEDLRRYGRGPAYQFFA